MANWMIYLSVIIILIKTCLIQCADEKKPNVLVILADDLGTGDIPGYYEDTCKVTSMKNIEDLVSKGIIFTDAHATPLCAPSRYAFLSGNYQFRGAGSQNGITTAVNWSLGWSGQFKKGQKSLADIFTNAGYNTAMVGKWHVGGKVPPNGRKSKEYVLTHPGHDWTQPIGGGPQDIGFKSSLITSDGIQSTPYSWFRDGMLQTNKTNTKYWTQGEYSMPQGTSKIIENGEGDADWDSTAYHMILVNETIRFLDEHLDKTPNDPFFVYFATGSVHKPHSPPKQYINGAAIDKTQYNAHMDMLFELDLVVGSLVQALQDRSLLEDTIIVFTSDNGGLAPGNSDNSLSFGHLTNGRLLGFKGSLYEGGHTIPMIMRYDKGLPSGQTRDRLIGITDLYATLAEMSGIFIPNGQAIDSISFANYARDGNNTQNLREYYGIWAIPDQEKGCAIRSSDHYKLIYSFNSSTIKWMSELYNLKNDPTESTDLSQNPSYLTLREKFVKKLLSLGPCCSGKNNCLLAYKPSSQPFKHPSNEPSEFPSKHPSNSPSKFPSKDSSNELSEFPSKHPSNEPPEFPSKHSSNKPLGYPSLKPTNVPKDKKKRKKTVRKKKRKKSLPKKKKGKKKKVKRLPK